MRSRDEFGEVTEAFNAVHLEAVRTAAEQAALRSSVATMFVNLARRSQILVDRLIGHLDRLERGEEDPDRLAELFQLDHLATRMRRNDENLLVLAGADSTRVQREPAALIDVLRAAQSEVEHYTRIEFGMIDRDLEVAAHAVNDLVHLVAELFDNATAFSPPDVAGLVEARRVGDRAVLYVEDHGIGIGMDQLADLNERLATPPMVDVAVSRMMGLVVVARLAARHGIKVELRPANDRGTVADVLLPTTVLVPRALVGRASAAPSAPAAGADPARVALAVLAAAGAGEWQPVARRLRAGPSAGRSCRRVGLGGFGGGPTTAWRVDELRSWRPGGLRERRRLRRRGGFGEPADRGRPTAVRMPARPAPAWAASPRPRRTSAMIDLFGNQEGAAQLVRPRPAPATGPEPATNKAGAPALPLPQRPQQRPVGQPAESGYSDLDRRAGTARPTRSAHIPRQRPHQRTAGRGRADGRLRRGRAGRRPVRASRSTTTSPMS